VVGAGDPVAVVGRCRRISSLALTLSMSAKYTPKSRLLRPGLRGTADVVTYARQRGVPVTVIWPQGATRG
jgi:spore coat protein U-like protein